MKTNDDTHHNMAGFENINMPSFLKIFGPANEDGTSTCRRVRVSRIEGDKCSPSVDLLSRLILNTWNVNTSDESVSLLYADNDGTRCLLLNDEDLHDALAQCETDALGVMVTKNETDALDVDFRIDVYSAGYNCGNTAKIVVNGQDKVSDSIGRYLRGLNVVVIDPKTKKAKETRHFDTHLSDGAAYNFASMIQSLSNGTIVAIAVKDEASRCRNQIMIDAARSIGSSEVKNFGWRGSWACVGIKGAAVGLAKEDCNDADSPSAVSYKL